MKKLNKLDQLYFNFMTALKKTHEEFPKERISRMYGHGDELDFDFSLDSISHGYDHFSKDSELALQIIKENGESKEWDLMVQHMPDENRPNHIFGDESDKEYNNGLRMIIDHGKINDDPQFYKKLASYANFPMIIEDRWNTKIDSNYQEDIKEKRK